VFYIIIYICINIEFIRFSDLIKVFIEAILFAHNLNISMHCLEKHRLNDTEYTYERYCYKLLFFLIIFLCVYLIVDHYYFKFVIFFN